jgi:pyrroline-5-carboxylate reductase
MPNMPALIGEGITAICAGRYASPADVKTAEKILQTIGQTVIVKESMIDAVTAVSGSGPAYVFLFVEQWINATIKLGFDRSQAKQLVYKTLLGSTHLLEKSEFDAAILRAKVTSKGGTTEAAMKVFFKSNAFSKLMKDALSAAKKRAKELAR